MKILGVIASSVFKIFTDNFNRTTSGSLGTPSGGGAWTAIRGVWFANGTKATSSGTASDYPIATSDIFSTAPTVLLDVDGNGVGAAFWVSDSSNWWGVVPWQDTAATTNYFSNCATYTSTCTSYTYYSYCQGYFQKTVNVRYGFYTKACDWWSEQTKCNTFGSACASYSQGSSISYSAGSRYLRLLKSVSNTVTTVADSAIAAAAASIKVVVTSGGLITASAYTSAGQVTQTGSDLTNTPASPTKATKHGILLAPGGVTQATTVDNLTLKMT